MGQGRGGGPAFVSEGTTAQGMNNCRTYLTDTRASEGLAAASTAGSTRRLPQLALPPDQVLHNCPLVSPPLAPLKTPPPPPPPSPYHTDSSTFPAANHSASFLPCAPPPPQLYNPQGPALPQCICTTQQGRPSLPQVSPLHSSKARGRGPSGASLRSALVICESGRISMRRGAKCTARPSQPAHCNSPLLANFYGLQCLVHGVSRRGATPETGPQKKGGAAEKDDGKSTKPRPPRHCQEAVRRRGMRRQGRRFHLTEILKP